MSNRAPTRKGENGFATDLSMEEVPKAKKPDSTCHNLSQPDKEFSPFSS